MRNQILITKLLIDLTKLRKHDVSIIFKENALVFGYEEFELETIYKLDATKC